MKQATTSGPAKVKGGGGKRDKKVTAGHGMAGLFTSVTPKKPEPDNSTRTRAGEARSKQARMKRLDGRLI